MDPDRARQLLTGELADLDERLRAAEDTRAEAAADTGGGMEGALSQHPADYGSEVNSSMEAALGVNTINEQRRRIQDALERLEDGGFGRCQVCDREIDDERLEARPEVRTCREHADTPVLS